MCTLGHPNLQAPQTLESVLDTPGKGSGFGIVPPVRDARRPVSTRGKARGVVPIPPRDEVRVPVNVSNSNEGW